MNSLSRRRLLALAALAAALPSCGAALPAAPRPVYPSRNLAGVAVRSDLQDLIDRTARSGGGTVEIPAGQTFLTAGVVVPAGVDLDVRGTIVRQPNARGVLLTLRGNGATVRGFPGGAVDGNRTAAGERSDVIRVAAADVTITGLDLSNSASNGIAVYGYPRARIESCRITNCRDNGVIVGNAGGDASLIRGNTLAGTDEQNAIFVTASSGSTPTRAFVRDHQILDNVITDVGDTGIESGIHTVNTLVRGNRVEAAKNPGILLRDCTGVRVENCTVTTTGPTIDAYAVVPQTQPSGTEVSSTFTRCTVVGNATRSGFYTDSSGVTVDRPTLSPVDGQATRGTAFLAGAVNDLAVLNATLGNWTTAFWLNYAGNDTTMERITVRAPQINGVDSVYYVPAALTESTLECGTVRGVRRYLFRSPGSTTLAPTSQVVPPAAGSAVGEADTSLP
ncbi:right-handed parallel beta-helix repeat-containing protein [Actinomycetospora termitidis]|uniref:Right-handed parallel beta-helix repeat-containing protein n=1 Tax=Actinomycetospora termitidis TaxID=3053470 RepID=A0ABT7MG78_9PSEU|nr:right-handed parallel beta-helix repeat-containing protein [Actinomycetospora sp. Odt1-22]MDL5158967.1 right-handed parallel beta-helix repeat-containing protein [Actinomycetospora sp. Odt1-22]